MKTKHLLYLSENCLTAYIWQNGKLLSEQVFTYDDAGLGKFSRRLSSMRDLPVYLLVDILEEDFQQLSTPHVRGRTRRRLIERKLVALYHDTPYRRMSSYGREKGGNRSDLMLASALTNPKIIEPWIEVIDKLNVPFRGIFSVSMLSQILMTKLKVRNTHVLLVSQQRDGLRETYLKNGVPMFSLLAHEARNSGSDPRAAIHLEIRKVREFLHSHRFMQQEETLDVLILVSANLEAVLNGNSEKGFIEPGFNFRFIDWRDVAKTVKLSDTAPRDVCDSLWLAVLGNTETMCHYGRKSEVLGFQLRLMGKGFYCVAAALLLMTSIYSIPNLADIYNLESNIRQVNQEISTERSLNEEVLENYLPIRNKSEVMKNIVCLYEKIAEYHPSPNSLFNAVSKALDKVPGISINSLAWNVSDEIAEDEKKKKLAGQQNMKLSGNRLSPSTIGIPARPAEFIVVEGAVNDAVSGSRAIIRTIEQFIDELERTGDIQIKNKKLPVDPSAKGAISGETGSDHAGDTVVSKKFTIEIKHKMVGGHENH